MNKVSFPVFFQMWATRMGWDVPIIHWIAVNWIQDYGDLGILRCFRGFGKSTILAVYNAWRLYDNPTYRILHQSEADGTAFKTSRDTQNVLRRHPLCAGLLPDGIGTVEAWSVTGNEDARNASMYSRGILSNVTSARCDEAQNDDVEVQRNTTTEELREKLRYRLTEQTHIMVPGARQLFIGTPHSFDSLYDEMEQMPGANCLTIKLFNEEFSINGEKAGGETSFDCGFVPVNVFVGIGKGAKMLRCFVDYTVSGTVITFANPVKLNIDVYGQCNWPKRFDRAELEKRRRKCRTMGEWESQYLLRSKPIHKVRLDPDRLREYDTEITLKTANKETRMYLGSVHIVSAACRWDVASGKVKADASALSLVLTDNRGHIYWHFCEELTGEIAEFNDRDQICGGQVWQIRDLCKQFHIPRVTVETNGIGGFAPKLLRQALKGTGVAVVEDHVQSNKQMRILEAFEGPLSGRFMWAHTRVMDGPAYNQMRMFQPQLTNQADDFIDSGAGAVLEVPARIGGLQFAALKENVNNWRPTAQQYEVKTE